MCGVILAVLGVFGFAILFILLSDGRYFGKKLVYWLYDYFGPKVLPAHRETQLWHALIDLIHLRGNENVLDVGTAVGDLPLTIAAMPNFHGRVAGVDWSPRMIAVAQREAHRRGLGARASFQVADVRKPLPFDDGEFDLIFCLGVLESLPQSEKVLKELKRLLAPEGILVLSLYRSKVIAHVALGLDWYQRQLFPMGAQDLQPGSFGRHHSVVIARF